MNTKHHTENFDIGTWTLEKLAKEYTKIRQKKSNRSQRVKEKIVAVMHFCLNNKLVMIEKEKPETKEPATETKEPITETAEPEKT